MSLGNTPLGSKALGGAPAAGDVSFSHATQTLALTQQTPIWIVKHSNPATFTLSLTIEAVTVKTIHNDSTQSLSLTQQAPGVNTTAFPDTLALNLTQYGPVNNGLVLPGTQSLTLTFSADEPDSPEIGQGPALFTLTVTGLDVHLPTVNIVAVPRSYAAPFRLAMKAPKVPHWSDLTPEIVRYIKDPQVTGGCAQCGTFLYADVRGRPLRGERVSSGRNFDLGAYPEDRWIRCGRCGFLNHPIRNIKDKEGSRTGWGMKYVEVEAGSE